MNGKILITGGAGYIGGTTARLLYNMGYEIIILDNFTTGSINNLEYFKCTVYEGDIRDEIILNKIFSENEILAVIHFAGVLSVPESIIDPLKYYDINVGGSLQLIKSMKLHNVDNLIFSSTAAVYGNVNTDIVDELHPTNPINPYGSSKMFTENIIKDSGLKYSILRYFNVDGTDGDIRKINGESLIKVIVDSIVSGKNTIDVYGCDFNTKDGSPVRDFIHISDLAEAHVICLDNLLNGGYSDTYNVGSGAGSTVLEVIYEIQKFKNISYNLKDRRTGDPEKVVADISKIEKIGFKPKRSNIQTIINSVFD